MYMPEELKSIQDKLLNCIKRNQSQEAMSYIDALTQKKPIDNDDNLIENIK